jgi:hypothetical protein
MFFLRFSDCTRPVSVVVRCLWKKEKQDLVALGEASVDFGAPLFFFSYRVSLCHLIAPSLLCLGP